MLWYDGSTGHYKVKHIAMKHSINRMSRFWYQPSLGMLVIRIAAGIIFVRHGWMKLMTLPMTEQFFHFLGLPAWVAPFVAGVEVLGGLMLILGILSRVAGVALMIDMLVAIFITGFAHGFAPHEFEFVLFAISAAVALGGSGRYSLYAMECKHCGAMLCRGECRQ